MTTWLLKYLDYPNQPPGWQGYAVLFSKEICLMAPFLTLLFACRLLDLELFNIVFFTMGDAYLGVSIFVAMTLGLFYGLDRHLKTDLTKLLNHKSAIQVPIAAFLGALPGCGGAIIVVTQFVNGGMSFGALVAVLIATMGDAAFLLIAKKPDVALIVYGISLGVGIVFGYLINAVFGHDYLKPKSIKNERNISQIPRTHSIKVKAFIYILAPGAVLGLLEAFQIESNKLFGAWSEYDPVAWIGFIGALLCVSVWVGQPLNSWSARFSGSVNIKHLKETVVAETSFISVWVILGFLSYEILIYATNINLQTVFEPLGALAILLAVVIGFVPGCGPQIITTTLYINGLIPLSAQLANAISNDGDALFPALALAPEAALKATAFSAIPALFVGYIAFYMGW